MKLKHQAIYALAFLFVCGCAAGPSKGEVEGLNKRISRLERSLDERVAEIDELESKFRLLREKLDRDEGGHALEANGITPPPGLKIIRLGEKSTLSIKGLPDDDEAEADKAEKQSADVEKTEAKAKTKTEKGLGSNSVPTPSGTTPSAETMYKKARELFLSGRFSDSRIIFQDLATTYPESSLADNAFYWSAESYFRKKNYNAAIVLYKIVVDRYPEGNKAADALWGIGASYLRLGDAEKARASWERILKEYPDSEAAASASKRLE